MRADKTCRESTFRIVQDSVFPAGNLQAYLSGVFLLADYISDRVITLVPGVH